MWLFTRHGFFSITESPTHAGQMQFRARLREDLEALKAARGIGARIVETPAPADYRFRFVVSREEMVEIVAQEAAAIDYGNFKQTVHEEPGQESKAGPYMRVWAAMLSLQTAREHRTPGHGDLFRPDEFTAGTEPDESETQWLREQPEGEPETWGSDVCICGNARRDHLHGKGHCLAPGCRCNAFVLASGQPAPAVDPLDNPKAPKGRKKRKSREALETITGRAAK